MFWNSDAEPEWNEDIYLPSPETIDCIGSKKVERIEHLPSPTASLKAPVMSEQFIDGLS